jgi:hypothetical protein
MRGHIMMLKTGVFYQFRRVPFLMYFQLGSLWYDLFYQAENLYLILGD